MSPAGRYRRVRSRLWLDPPFVGLTEGEKLVALYVLSGPPTNSVGLYRLSPALAAEDLAITVETFRRRFDAVRRAFRWRYDAATRVLWVPTWIADNSPQNPNVVRSWRAAFDEIPDSPVKAEAVEFVQTFLDSKAEPFGKAFREPSAAHSANTPDPDPENEMVRRTERGARQRASAAQTRETVRRLSVLAEHNAMRGGSGS